MLNPDGVINGNTRWSLSGWDLNRRWNAPKRVKLFRIFILKFITLKEVLGIGVQPDKLPFIVIFMGIVKKGMHSFMVAITYKILNKLEFSHIYYKKNVNFFHLKIANSGIRNQKWQHQG